MPYKIILKGNEARDKALKGANFLADCVRSTLGIFGRNCLMEKGQKITNDGVTISQEIASGIKDEIERRGATTLHEAASKTNTIAGDGTTTAIILAQEILKEAMKYLGTGTIIGSKKTPSEVVRTIEKEKTEVIEKLTAMAKPVETEDELIKSAIVAVEDETLGELIGKAQWQLGKDGVLIAEQTAERKSSVEFVYGIRIDNGFSNSLVINNHEKQSLELDNASVILTNSIFNNDLGILPYPRNPNDDPCKNFPLAPVLEQLYKAGQRDVVIIGRAFAENAIRECSENMREGFRIYPINAPYTDQSEVMKDLAAVLGGTFFHVENSVLDNMQVSDVGFATRIDARRHNAVFTGKKDEHSAERIARRIEELENAKAGDPSEFMKKLISNRIAQLKSGFGIIKIGSTSDVDRKHKADKAEDAVNAVRAALQEGTVRGAGLAYKEIADNLPEDYILKRPLMSIYEQIKSTAPADFVVEEWVRDPLKVLRVALEEACSVAAIFSTIGVVIAAENVKDKVIIKEE